MGIDPKNPGAGNVATIYKHLTEDDNVRYTAYIRLKGHPKQFQTFDRKADAIRWAKQPSASRFFLQHHSFF
jgi:hypothetical protein